MFYRMSFYVNKSCNRVNPFSRSGGGENNSVDRRHIWLRHLLHVIFCPQELHWSSQQCGGDKLCRLHTHGSPFYNKSCRGELCTTHTLLHVLLHVIFCPQELHWSSQQCGGDKLCRLHTHGSPFYNKSCRGELCTTHTWLHVILHVIFCPQELQRSSQQCGGDKLCRPHTHGFMFYYMSFSVIKSCNRVLNKKRERTM